jgi:hypothetical protein
VETLRWRQVALTSVVVGTLAAACVWAPVLAHNRELRERSRVEHLAAARDLDASGFAPCRAWWEPPPPPPPGGADPGPLEPPPGPYEPTDAELAVTVMPAFDGPWRVALHGGRVHLEDKGIHSRRRRPPPEGLLRKGDVAIDPALAKRVHGMFARYASAPMGPPRLVLDGTYYRIETKGHCAETWSPDSESGAGRLVDIAQLMALRASRGEVRDGGRSERAIEILLASFEHGDGSELVDYGPARVETDAYISGPEWGIPGR